VKVAIPKEPFDLAQQAGNGFCLCEIGVDSGWVQNSTLGTEDALAVVSQIAVRVDVAIEGNGPHA